MSGKVDVPRTISVSLPKDIMRKIEEERDGGKRSTFIAGIISKWYGVGTDEQPYKDRTQTRGWKNK